MDDEDVSFHSVKSVVLPVIGDGKPPIPQEPPSPQFPEPLPIAITPLTRRVHVGHQVEEDYQKEQGNDKSTY